MGEPIQISFIDIVRRMGKTEEDNHIHLIFQKHAAVYHISETKTISVELLRKSMENQLPVQVLHDAETMEILNVDQNFIDKD